MKLRGMDIDPKTAEETKDAETPAGMRRRILQYSREDPMVRQVLDMARYHGMSGEDTYTVLAFNALRDRERFMDQVLDWHATHVPPYVIPKPE
jgi:hypothetical protein